MLSLKLILDKHEFGIIKGNGSEGFAILRAKFTQEP